MPSEKPNALEPPLPLIPYVDPVGVVRYPPGHTGAPRKYDRRLQGLATIVLMVFAVVVVVSTGWSLGSYCLTSDGANFFALAPWLSLSAG